MMLRKISRVSAIVRVLLAVCCGQLGQAVAAETAGQTSTAPALSPMQALEVQSAALEQTLSNQVQLMQQAQQAQAASDHRVNLVLLLAAVGVGVLAIRWLAPRVGELLNRRADPWAPAGPKPDPLDEELAFSKFAEDFTMRTSRPSPAVAASEPVAVAAPCAEEEVARGEDPVESFLRGAPEELAGMRAVFSGISSVTEPAVRQTILAQLQAELCAFKAKAHLPALQPCWQMAGALEGLLTQLVAKPAQVTPSALRTVATALDVLQALGVRNLKPDLVTDPPVRVLAVDDDAICRHALNFSLGKVLGPPDLASDGLAALALVEKVAYDVIFLDVELPGMNGFELCSRIGATAINGTTPVVFVTRHSDFDSRTQSCLRGGRDLLGKPFLTFELAVKALTMVMQRRLQTDDCARPGTLRPGDGAGASSQ
jgi:CheY-like chemotaxis protein